MHVLRGKIEWTSPDGKDPGGTVRVRVGFLRVISLSHYPCAAGHDISLTCTSLRRT